MLNLILLVYLFTALLSFGNLRKLDYDLLRTVKERKETLIAKSLLLKSAGRNLVVKEVKVLTKDGEVKVIDLSKRSLTNLMSDPGVVYIEAPKPINLKNDIVREPSYGVYGNTSLTVNSTASYLVYVNPTGVATSQSGNCTLLGQVLSSDLFQCSGSETLGINQDFRAVVVGVDKASISDYSEIYLVGTKSTLTPSDGSGVIVGVIDTGINFCHPAFLDINGNTRVKFFGFTMTQDVASNLVNNNLCSSSDPRNCCQDLGGVFDTNTQICELDSAGVGANIQRGVCNEADPNGHGTHVAGTAAGSDSSNLSGTGIAPGADLVVFLTAGFDSDIIKGLEWIKRKAQGLGKPAVVNMSLGHHFHPHDGTGLLDRKVDELSGQGFIVTVAASNEGGKPIHAYTTKTSDSILISVPAQTTIVGWYENPSRWLIEVCEQGTDNCVGTSSGNDMDSLKPVGNTNCQAQVFASMTNDPLNGDGRFQIDINCQSATDLLLRLSQICGDVARVDMWDTSEKGIFKSNYDTDVSGGYKFTVASPGTAKRAITVGAINSRPDNLLDQAAGFDTFLNLGKIANFSSRGPTRDGRIKPNVVAGGAYVISADANYDPVSSPNTLYKPEAGTSMATPVVAGLVALYLWSNPQATPEDVKRWLTSNAVRDVPGMNYPNEIYGYGKAVWSNTVGSSGSSQDATVSIAKGVGVGSCQASTGGGNGGGGCSTAGSSYILISLLIAGSLAGVRRWLLS